MPLIAPALILDHFSLFPAPALDAALVLNLPPDQAPALASDLSLATTGYGFGPDLLRPRI